LPVGFFSFTFCGNLIYHIFALHSNYFIKAVLTFRRTFSQSNFAGVNRQFSQSDFAGVNRQRKRAVRLKSIWQGRIICENVSHTLWNYSTLQIFKLTPVGRVNLSIEGVFII
jgi:hypothetical protein